MDFETSCWSAGTSLINGTSEFYNVDNPVQRRPRVDYFDSTTIMPIVSHISSNGYYGYCPAMHHNQMHQVNSPAVSSATSHGINISESDMDVPVESTATEFEPQQHQPQPTYQGHRKRSVQCIDEFIPDQDIKRKRQNHLSMIDCVEGLLLSISVYSTRARMQHCGERL